MRNIIYCRVSNFKITSFSYQSQEAECFNYCKKNNMKIHEIHKEYRSGYGKQKELYNIIKKNKNINLILYDTTRFSRHMMYGKCLLDMCIDKNIIVHFVKEKTIFSKESSIEQLGKIMMGLAYSEEEWNNIRKRIVDSIKYRKQMGMCLGTVPYGFDNNGGYLVKNEDFNVIRLIVSLRNGNKSVPEIRNILQKLSHEHELLQFYDENDKPINKFTNSLTLDFSEIKDILNDFNIRDKNWNTTRVRELYNKYCNDTEFINDTVTSNINNLNIS
jgi:DNA invertase Pin-like site-specific DNA recombinase